MSAVLIAAASGRALAASARRGGYVPLVADFFGDLDTAAIAHAHVLLETGLARGMEAEELLGAFENLAVLQSPAGVVCGTGFEDRPEVLGRIADRWRLLGNKPETVARLKDPLTFAALCRDCGIPHPETTAVPPADPHGWLVKRRGGAGGRHIKAANGQSADAAFYFQRSVPGTPVSALVLANQHDALVLGFSTQWSSPTTLHPYRYGGAVRPAPLHEGTAESLTDAVRRLVSAVPLVGMNSVDFLVADGAFWLLEVNPRPGATIDIFEHDHSLFARHVDACNGVLPSEPPHFDGAMASAIVYAGSDIAQVPSVDWPEWTADRPIAGSSVKAEQPFCTVMAQAENAIEARYIVERRAVDILARAKVDA